MADGRRGAGARAGSSARRAAVLAVLAALAAVCLGADVARAARSRRMEAAALQVQVLGGAGAVPDVAAALAANGAAVAGGADQDTVIRISTPVRELENAGGFEKRSLNDDMVRHIDAAGASTESEPTNNGTSLCGGLVCPYLSGVCCPGTTHCCMEGYICSGGYPPTCLDARVDDEQTQSKPTRTRIVSVSVTRPNGQTTTTQLSPPPAPAASSQAPVAPVNSAPAPAVGPAPLPPGILTLQNVQPPTTLTVGIQNLENGPAWPPMAAYAPDGTPRAYVQADQRDWLGGGLQRNGTYNMVVNETLCQQQCDALEECAVYRYVRTNGECWLDTAVSPTPGPCPVVSGVRNCVSGVRRADDRVVAAYPYPDPSAVTLGDWYAVEQRNWLPSSAQLAQQGGRLIRQGKQNIVATPAECVKQCADLKYCAVAMFMRSTGECWLSSRLAPRSSGGSPCALRGSVRDCASYVRRKKDERDPKNAAPVDAWAPGASAAAQSAALAQVSGLGAAVTQASASLPSNSGSVSVAIPLPRS